MLGYLWSMKRHFQISRAIKRNNMLTSIRRITFFARNLCHINITRPRQSSRILQAIKENMISARRLHTQAKLRCTPLTSLIDHDNKVSIEGLDPGEKVTLRARLVSDTQERYHSYAHFVADKDGNVDVSSQASVGGFYQGVHPMGFMWSLRAEPGQREGLRLVKKDVTTPHVVELDVIRGHVTNDDGTHQGICSLACQKWYMGQGVQRLPVRHGNIRGTLFLPPGNGKFPGVIDMFGSSGGLLELKASFLASYGFAVLALAFFRYDDLPQTMEGITLEYFIEATNWLKDHPQVAAGGIGLNTFSKSCEIAIYLASVSDDVKAIVLTSPLYGFCLAPVTYKGKPTKIVSLDPSLMIKEEDGSLNIVKSATHKWEGSIKDDPHIPPVEGVNCPALVVVGTDDRNTDAEKAVEVFFRRLKSHGKSTVNFTVLRYEGAGHLIEPPHSPHCYSSFHKPLNGSLTWGGKPLEHALAQEDAWKRIVDFFAKNLPAERNSKL